MTHEFAHTMTLRELLLRKGIADEIDGVQVERIHDGKYYGRNKDGDRLYPARTTANSEQALRENAKRTTEALEAF